VSGEQQAAACTGVSSSKGLDMYLY
jgi:hypothetical protein